VGQAGSHGLHVGARVLATNDCANAQSTRRLLLNPFIDAMVVEISEISVLREGLAFDRCKVAVVTNLGSGDHLGEQYVDELSLVAKAVRAPVDVVLPDGYAVLNADDPQVVAMAEKCRGQIIYFSQNPNQALLHDHLHQGGRAVVVHEGKILILGNKQREGLLDLGRLGSTMLGLPAQLVENLLAATAACVALGLPTDAIRQGIERNLHQDGIAIYDAEGCLVVLSPARNASALAAWTRSLGQAFPGRATHAVFEVTPDWRPADAQNIGQLARECFATLTLVCPASADPRVANLCQIMEHPCLAQENSLSDAIDRISRNFGSSHSIFVMTSVRSSYDLANAHCRKRNMVRQNLTGLATMGHSR
jgi:cyanophycin synthetase